MQSINRKLPLVVPQPLPPNISLRTPYGNSAEFSKTYIASQLVFWLIEALHELNNGKCKNE